MNRIFQLQEKYLEKISEYEKPGNVRDLPLSWERIHMISCAKIGQLLARQRGVDEEMAAIACSVHDYGRIVTGRQVNHAAAGYEPLLGFLRETGLVTPAEAELLARAAKNHSSKHEVGSPLEEIVKDADVLNCYQYGMPAERPEQKKRLQAMLEGSVVG